MYDFKHVSDALGRQQGSIMRSHVYLLLIEFKRVG